MRHDQRRLVAPLGHRHPPGVDDHRVAAQAGAALGGAHPVGGDYVHLTFDGSGPVQRRPGPDPRMRPGRSDQHHLGAVVDHVSEQPGVAEVVAHHHPDPPEVGVGHGRGGTGRQHLRFAGAVPEQVDLAILRQRPAARVEEDARVVQMTAVLLHERATVDMHTVGAGMRRELLPDAAGVAGGGLVRVEREVARRPDLGQHDQLGAQPGRGGHSR